MILIDQVVLQSKNGPGNSFTITKGMEINGAFAILSPVGLSIS